MEWQREIDDYAEYLRSHPQPAAERDESKRPEYKDARTKRFPFTAEQATEMAERYGQTRRTIKLSPEVKMTFVRIPQARS